MASARLGIGILAALVLASGQTPAHAQKERGGILKELIEGIAPGSPSEAEALARTLRDGSDALRAYGSLQARGGDDPAVVRACLWVGLYYYGAGDVERSIEYFEKARSTARDPDLMARAEFWCEQARLQAGREPMSHGASSDASGYWTTLHSLNHADRALREGKNNEAESWLLRLEGDARRNGLLGLLLARWGDLIRAGESARVGQPALEPLVRECAGLPERLRMVGIGVAPAREVAEPGGWTIQTGAFLDPENARRQQTEVRERGLDPRIEERREDEKTWYLVRVGEYGTREEADSAASALLGSAGLPFEIQPIP